MGQLLGCKSLRELEARVEDVLARTSNWEGYRLVEAALLALLAALREPRMAEGLVHLDLRSSSWIAASLLLVLLFLLASRDASCCPFSPLCTC